MIDPARVTRSALQNGVSIANLILTTEVVVAETGFVPEGPPGGAGGGMGGMDPMGGMGGMGGMGDRAAWEAWAEWVDRAAWAAWASRSPCLGGGAFKPPVLPPSS